jgi:hypothetical protein
MKKLFATLFFILVAAGLAFFFGWAHIGVPPDSVGVVRSKTHGTDPRPIKPGEFRWLWYKLIPTNAKTAVFRLNTVYRDFSAGNYLPSGQVYSAFSGIEGNFSWKISAVLSFNLRPEALISPVTVHNICTQEELAVYERDIAGQIEAFIMRHLALGGTFASQFETLLKNGESPELNREIAGQFPAVTNFSLRVKSADIPDFDLYRQVKGLYDDYIAGQKEYISENLEGKVKNRIESALRLDELERYGVLLTKYPVLLEYLALENGRGTNR